MCVCWRNWLVARAPRRRTTPLVPPRSRVGPRTSFQGGGSWPLAASTPRPAERSRGQGVSDGAAFQSIVSFFHVPAPGTMIALGAAVAGRLAARIRRPVLAYGVLELLIAVGALLVPLGIRAASTVYLALLGGLEAPPEVSRAEAETTFSASRLSFLRESRTLDTTRMREVLGFTPRYGDPEEGIRASLG